MNNCETVLTSHPKIVASKTETFLIDTSFNMESNITQQLHIYSGAVIFVDSRKTEPYFQLGLNDKHWNFY